MTPSLHEESESEFIFNLVFLSDFVAFWQEDFQPLIRIMNNFLPETNLLFNNNGMNIISQNNQVKK
jgi:hypothetical protein